MRPSRFMPLAFAAIAIAIAACSGTATAPSAAAPTTAPATTVPTTEPVASATPASTSEPVASPTAPQAAAAGCLDGAVHAVLYKGLKDPGSLTDGDLETLRAGFEAWEPSTEWHKEYREWFLGDGGTLAKVAGSFMLRAGEETIEACP